MPLEVGDRVGAIRVEALLGQGGMSEVYRGFDEESQRPVALKVVQRRRLGAMARVRFLREARILAQLDHPNICKVYDLVSGGEADVMVLELIEGATLRAAMGEGLSFGDKLRIGEVIASVLTAAHRQGIVHRDLKPDNVMRTNDGAIKVLDFDLARPADEHRTWEESRRPDRSLRPSSELDTTLTSDSDTDEMRTSLGTIVGTAAYMSPEQARGEPLTIASDLYTFGVLLHELFTGDLPYPDDLPLRARLLRVADGDTLPARNLDRQLTVLIESLKQLDPMLRPTAEQAAATLRAIRGRSEKTRPSTLRAIARTISGGWRRLRRTTVSDD
jgi:serine/threonine protein kinase